jgi:vacuolar protein sorting-associated protein VTA1
MPTQIPPELKKITQYVRRAEELDRDKTNVESRLVAYYCRQYAVQTGIPLATASPNPATANATLGTLLEDLEKEKPAMANFTKAESYMVCRAFAMKVFDRADGQDRAGNSGKGTAKSFFVASSFLDILKQFGDGGGEIRTEEQALEEEKKSFYAKWKSTDILKAIKEGREPTPGGYTDNKDGDDGDDGDEDNDNGTGGGKEEEEEEEEGIEVPLPPPVPQTEEEPSAPPPPPYPGMTSSLPKKKSSSPLKMFSKSSNKSLEASNVMNVSKDSMKDAKEFTKVALKSLDKKNAQLAVDNLQRALGCLGRTNNGSIGSRKISRDAMKDAKELSKFASKALDVKDADLAVERMEQALGCLGL